MPKATSAHDKPAKLKAVRKAQAKLMAPLPGKLLKTTEARKLRGIAGKLTATPKFVDFEPLDAGRLKQAQEGLDQPKDEAPSEEPLKKRFHHAALQAQSPSAPRKTVGESKFPAAAGAARKDAGPTPPPIGSGKKLANPARYKLAEDKSADRAKPDSQQHTPHQGVPPKQDKPGRNVYEGALLLKRLLEELDQAESRNQTLRSVENKGPDKQSLFSAHGDKASAAGKFSGSGKGPTRSEGMPTALAATKAIRSGDGRAAMSQTSEAASANIAYPHFLTPATANSPAASAPLLDQLVDRLWQLPASAPVIGSDSPAQSSGQTASATRSGQVGQRDSALSASSHQTATSARASGIAIPELEVTPRHPEAPPGSESESRLNRFHREAELAESINRALKEQAWLRGVNLP